MVQIEMRKTTKGGPPLQVAQRSDMAELFSCHGSKWGREDDSIFLHRRSRCDCCSAQYVCSNAEKKAPVAPRAEFFCRNRSCICCVFVFFSFSWREQAP